MSNKISLIHLDSRYGTFTNNYDTKFELNIPRLETVDGYSVSVHKVEFPNTVYPVNEFNQNFFFFETLGGGDISIVIPEGVYTGTNMATTLATLMTAASNNAITYTGTYDSVTTKTITIAASGGNTWAYEIGQNAIYEQIGFSLNNITEVNSKTSDYPVRLDGSRYVDVVSNLSTNNYSFGASTNVLVRIPLSVSFGSIVFYEPNVDDEIFVSHNQMDEIRIALRDEQGNLFKLPDNGHFSITLKLKEGRDFYSHSK